MDDNDSQTATKKKNKYSLLQRTATKINVLSNSTNPLVSNLGKSILNIAKVINKDKIAEEELRIAKIKQDKESNDRMFNILNKNIKIEIEKYVVTCDINDMRYMDEIFKSIIKNDSLDNLIFILKLFKFMNKCLCNITDHEKKLLISESKALLLDSNIQNDDKIIDIIYKIRPNSIGTCKIPNIPIDSYTEESNSPIDSYTEESSDDKDILRRNTLTDISDLY